MTYIIHIIHIIHISSPTVNDRQSPAVQLGKDFQKKSGLQRSNGHKLWWLVDMMSARSVFHSKVWHFNFSGNRSAVLPSLAISPLTVVLLQAGIKLWYLPERIWPPKPPRAYTIVLTLLQANEQWYRGSTLDRGKLSTEWAHEDMGP